jgi:N-acetylneuraminic acid mutarotase
MQRTGHSVVEFNNLLWLIGGRNGEYLNDVWSSPDGASWTQRLANATAPAGTRFLPRAGQGCAVFDGKLWVTGGEYDAGGMADYYDDVWWSANGLAWNLATGSADFWARGFHRLVAFNNQLWILGGQTLDEFGQETLLGDAWSSGDGQHWTERSTVAGFFPRKHLCAAGWNGKLLVWSGFGYNTQGTLGLLHDAWQSTDGTLWSRVYEQGVYSPRYGAAATVHEGKLWMVGGWGKDDNGWEAPLNDVWSSGDGTTWTRILGNGSPGTQHFSNRFGAEGASLGGRIFLIGGEDPSGPVNDTWSSE